MSARLASEHRSDSGYALDGRRWAHRGGRSSYLRLGRVRVPVEHRVRVLTTIVGPQVPCSWKEVNLWTSSGPRIRHKARLWHNEGIETIVDESRECAGPTFPRGDLGSPGLCEGVM